MEVILCNLPKSDMEISSDKGCLNKKKHCDVCIIKLFIQIFH